MYLIPAVTGFSKLLGSKMGIRLLILAVVGLGAMYTMHLLAMDWMKIQNGVMAGKQSELKKVISNTNKLN